MADTREIFEHGLECISKATEPVQPGYKLQYQLRTNSRTSGLSERFKTTTMDVPETAVKIPATPLDNRNHIEVHNLSDEILYVADNNLVTADAVIGITSGKEVPARSFFNIDIRAEIELYAIAPAGKTIKVKITEVA